MLCYQTFTLQENQTRSLAIRSNNALMDIARVGSTFELDGNLSLSFDHQVKA